MSGHLRIGLYGGMANAMYVFAKALAADGRDIIFVRDASDNYPLAQPFWQDCRLAMSLTGERRWTREQLVEEEIRAGWVSPPWLFDVDRCDQATTPTRPRSRPFFKSNTAHQAMVRQLQVSATWQRVLGALQSCDVLMVCGLDPEQLAYLSGRPYLIWPHGGDARAAAGYPSPKDDDPLAPALRLQQACLALAFRHASWIGNHDPTIGGGSYCAVDQALAGKVVEHVPWPIPRRARPDPQERTKLRARLFAELEVQLPTECCVAFIPSRIDYFWKGHDRLIEGAAGIHDIHFVFAGWGRDYDVAITRARELGVMKQMTFLPVSLSKPILYEMFAASDFVVDQFTHGSYGGAAVEAMAGSVPVMMNIDVESYTRRGWEPPPVLNCRTREDVHAALDKIASNEIDLEELGTRAGAWAERIHSPAAVLSVLDRLLSQRTTKLGAMFRRGGR